MYLSSLAYSVVYQSPSLSRQNAGVKNVNADRKYCKTNGTINFSTQYFADEHILEVLFNEVNGLALKELTKTTFPSADIFIRVCLDPGKLHKRETASFKGNEQFINVKVQFENMYEMDLQKYRLKIKLFHHKEGMMKKNALLGQLNLDLSSIDHFSLKQIHVAPIYDM